MMASGGGRIVNVSSRGAFRGEPESPAYGQQGRIKCSQSVARAETRATRYLRGVWSRPGFVETDMTTTHLAGEGGRAIRAQSPLNRVAKPEEVAYAVLFLASEGAEFTTGTIIDVNGASYLRS